MIQTIIFLPTGHLSLIDSENQASSRNLLDETITKYIEEGVVSPDTTLLCNHTNQKLGDCYKFPEKDGNGQT